MTMRVKGCRETVGVAVKAACVVCAAVVGTTPALGQNWTNTTGNRNFADFANWSGGLSSFTGTNRDWTITLTGTNRAELATALATNLQRDLTVGIVSAPGELVFNSGSSITVTRNMRLGNGGGTTGYGDVTFNGGSLNVASNLLVGQSERAENVFRLGNGSVNVTGNLDVAPDASTRGTLNVSGGTFAAGALRVGFGSSSVAAVSISSGSINVPTSFVTFGQGPGASVNVSMTGGTINADRMFFANGNTGDPLPAPASATLSMTAGTINTLRTNADNTGSGAFGMGRGNPSLSIAGTARVNAGKFNMNSGGVLDLGGTALINVTGQSTTVTDSVASFDFAATQTAFLPWSSVNGNVNFSSLGAVLRVAGQQETATFTSGTSSETITYSFATLFDQAIANGKFTQSVGPEYSLQAGYDAQTGFTSVSVVPEPSSIVLALGSFALAGLGLRARRRS